MITTKGKETILRYFGGRESQIGSSLEVGIGSAPFNPADLKLSFPAYAVNVEIVGVDLAASTVVFKSTLPESIAGVFTEMGLSYSPIGVGTGKNESLVLTNGNQGLESWEGGESAATNVRFGDRGIRLNNNNNTVLARMLDFTYDFSEYSVLDQFGIAFHSLNDVDTFRLRFMVDANNYFQFSTPVGAGFEIIRFSKGDFTTVGSPSWGGLVYMEIESVSNGVGSLTFDALRIDDKDSVNKDSYLVSRVVLATPFTKIAGEPLEIEYGVIVTI